MSPRPYTLGGAREAAIADTRQRVLAAARTLLLDHDLNRLTMNEVARLADVARATVYHQYHSKLGLIGALVEDFEQRAGLDTLITVVNTDPPDQLLRSMMRAGCAYWATDPDLVRKISALGNLQHDVQQLLAQHDAGRLDILRHTVHRLTDARMLAADHSPDEVLNVLWVLTSFDAYDLLTRGRRLSHHDAAQTLIALAAPLARASDPTRRGTSGRGTRMPRGSTI